MPGVPNPFPSLKARAMLRLLQAELGYAVVRQSGSHLGWQRKDGRS
jgi:predicted RNA binding protein YcfA (HicA-like mRNA interferase family)